jgi:hypothetical protein
MVRHGFDENRCTRSAGQELCFLDSTIVLQSASFISFLLLTMLSSRAMTGKPAMYLAYFIHKTKPLLLARRAPKWNPGREFAERRCEFQLLA